MNVTVFSEFHCALAADGSVCTLNGGRRYGFWTRYLDVFDHVTAVGRLSRRVVEGVPVTGPGVSFHALPDYSGAAEYLLRYRSVHRAINAACHADSAFILRVPGRAGTQAGRVLRRAGTPYAVEIVGNPHDVFARGAVRHPLRPLLRRMFTADLERLARHACAASYVTDHTLQRAYPCPAFSIGASTVDLGAGAIASDWRHADPHQRAFTIVTVGTLAQLYKGPDVLLDAVAQCVERGLDIHVVFVGDGRFRHELERRAAALGLADRATFRGHLPAGAAVRAELDAADLFVLPSRAEGLPRALIEAMARGIPCIASRVGGIPELLAEEDLVAPGDAVGLGQKLEQVLRSPYRREQMAARCLARAHDFSSAALRAARREFYREVLQRARRAPPVTQPAL